MSNRSSADTFTLAMAVALYAGPIVSSLWNPATEMWTLIGPKSSSDYAAWVQAFGSIAAVMAAFIVTYVQLRYARRLEQEKRVAARSQRLEGFNALLGRILFFLVQVQGAGSSWKSALDKQFSLKKLLETRSYERQFAIAARGLHLIPLAEYGDVAFEMLLAIESVETAAHRLAELKVVVDTEGVPPSAEAIGLLLQQVHAVHMRLHESMETVRTAKKLDSGAETGQY